MTHKTKYCEETGKPHTLTFDDGLCVGVHRRGSQVTVPLGDDLWSTLCMNGKVQIIFNSDEQIDLLIQRMEELKTLKNNYNMVV